MCGIAGFWNLRTGRPASRSLVGAMVRTLAHRGPDEEGVWTDGALALGARRLVVIDPAGGHQPMANEDGSVVAVFNGEIYNHPELRQELGALGHRVRTRSDTEVIVHAFEQWGTDCFARFDGMFAIAIWDSRDQALVLARDHLGIKPLYVADTAEGPVFGSELKAVIEAPWVTVDWDLESVDDFLTYEYVPAPRTIVRGIEKLEAGTWRRYRASGGGSSRQHRFWRLEAAGRPPASVAAAGSELRDRLRLSVRRRIVADVPVGAFLSGGIDSTIIVALMASETPGMVHTFSLGFADPSYDELDFARIAAKAFRTVHREQVVTPRVVEAAEQMADAFDEPFADVSVFPTHLISVLARRDVTVALSGDGGDELFAGYDHYRAHRWAERLRWLPWGLVDRVLAGLPPATSKKGPRNSAKRFAAGFRQPADLEHARWWVFWDLAERRALYDPEAGGRLEERDCLAYYRQRLQEGADAGFQGLSRQLYADITGYLADDILVKLDRASMAASLEARVPYLDSSLVEFAMTIPAEWKLRGRESKWLLRQAFLDRLPPAIAARGKRGFSIPLKNWLRGPLEPLLRELLATPRIRQRGWFRPEEIARLVDEHVRGRENHAHRLWCLMSLELALSGLERRVAARPATPRYALR